MRAFFQTCRSPLLSITVAAVIMAIAGIASRLLGFVRDRILAARFGAGDILDVYYASFRLPDTLFELLVLGALSAAFVPIFTQLCTKERTDAAWRMAGGVMTILVGVVGVIAVFLMIGASWFVPMMVPGFDAQKTAMTVTFTQWMLLSPIAMAISAVCGSILMSLHRFTLYAFAPLVYNLGIICGAVVIVPFFGPIGLAWGVVVGAFLHMIVTLRGAMSVGFRGPVPLRIAWDNSDVRAVLRLMIPRMFGSATQQISMLSVTFFASLTATGTLAAFTLANNIGGIPIGIIGIPFAVAAFPTLSAHWAREDRDSFAALVVKYVRRTLFLVLPLSMLLITLRAQIVRVVFGAGVFDWQDTVMTFQILGILALGIVAQSLIPLLARTFYAMHDTRTPVWVGIVGVCATVSTVSLLLKPLGAFAIAWGFTVGSIIQFVALFILLERRLCHRALTVVHNAVLGSLGSMSIASIVTFGVVRIEGLSITALPPLAFIGMSAIWLGVFAFCATALRGDLFFARLFSMTVIAAIAAQVMKFIIGTVTDLSSFGEVFLQLILAGGVGIGVYLFLAAALHIEEFVVLRSRAVAYILRKNIF